MIKLSGQDRRRIAMFKANRRGYLSFWILCVVFFITLFAEFLANDRPILVGFRGSIYAQILSTCTHITLLPAPMDKRLYAYIFIDIQNACTFWAMKFMGRAGNKMYRCISAIKREMTDSLHSIAMKNCIV